MLYTDPCSRRPVLPDSHVQLLTGAKRRFKPVYNQTSIVQLLTRKDFIDISHNEKISTLYHK